MKKKRIILALSFATICGGVWAQEQSPLLWPIKGQEAGLYPYPIPRTWSGWPQRYAHDAAHILLETIS